MSEFEANFPEHAGKKDIFKDKKRIKRIIFLETREVEKIQTTPNLCLYPLFQIYPSSYIGASELRAKFCMRNNKIIKHTNEDPLNANEQDSPTFGI